MHKTTLVVDDELVEQAANALGTRGIKQTVDAALKQAIRNYAKAHLLEVIARGIDFGVAERLEEIERAEIEGSDWRRFLPT